MKIVLNKSEQIDKFLEVIEYLKKKGFKQKDIAQKIDVDIKSEFPWDGNGEKKSIRITKKQSKRL